MILSTRNNTFSSLINIISNYKEVSQNLSNAIQYGKDPYKIVLTKNINENITIDGSFGTIKLVIVSSADNLYSITGKITIKNLNADSWIKFRDIKLVNTNDNIIELNSGNNIKSCVKVENCVIYCYKTQDLNMQIFDVISGNLRIHDNLLIYNINSSFISTSNSRFIRNRNSAASQIIFDQNKLFFENDNLTENLSIFRNAGTSSDIQIGFMGNCVNFDLTNSGTYSASWDLFISTNTNSDLCVYNNLINIPKGDCSGVTIRCFRVNSGTSPIFIKSNNNFFYLNPTFDYRNNVVYVRTDTANDNFIGTNDALNHDENILTYKIEEIGGKINVTNLNINSTNTNTRSLNTNIDSHIFLGPNSSLLYNSYWDGGFKVKEGGFYGAAWSHDATNGNMYLYQSSTTTSGDTLYRTLTFNYATKSYEFHNLPNTGTGNPVYIDTTSNKLYEFTSSKKYKKNIQDINLNTEFIHNIKLKQYDRFVTGSGPIKEIGYIAEDIEREYNKVNAKISKIFPIGLYKNKELYSYNFNLLIFSLIEEVKKLRKDINTLYKNQLKLANSIGRDGEISYV